MHKTKLILALLLFVGLNGFSQDIQRVNNLPLINSNPCSVATIANCGNNEEGRCFNICGCRADTTQTFVEGMRVIGSVHINKMFVYDKWGDDIELFKSSRSLDIHKRMLFNDRVNTTNSIAYLRQKEQPQFD